MKRWNIEQRIWLVVAMLCMGTLQRIYGQKYEPNIYTVQYAGNIGCVSIGAGWDYGKNERWESHVLLGYLPKEMGNEDIMYKNMATLSLRQNLIPWELGISEKNTLNPAVFSFTINTTINKDALTRIHIGFGSRLNISLPQTHQDSKGTIKTKRGKQITLYYELSSYDLDILTAVNNHDHRWRDLLALGLGVQYRFF